MSYISRFCPSESVPGDDDDDAEDEDDRVDAYEGAADGELVHDVPQTTELCVDLKMEGVDLHDWE